MKFTEYCAGRIALKKTPGLFGVEIETEVPNLEGYPGGIEFLNPHFDNDYTYVAALDRHVKDYGLWGGAWKGVIDGSLRNFGIEYVLKKPLSLKETLKAIDEFGEKTKDVAFIQNAPGTSVHVHINMQDEEIITMASFIGSWIILENILVEYSGESRRSNLFALPGRVADGVLAVYCSMFKQFLEDKNSAFRWSESTVKYSALNVAPLQKFGSIEIRTLRGITDPEILKEWIYILNSMLEFSRKKKPSDILRLYHMGGYNLLLEEIFPDRAFLSSIDHLEARIEDRLNDLYRFVRSADWDLVKDKTFPKAKTPEELMNEFIASSSPAGHTQMSTGVNPLYTIEHDPEEDSYTEVFFEEDDDDI